MGEQLSRREFLKAAALAGAGAAISACASNKPPEVATPTKELEKPTTVPTKVAKEPTAFPTDVPATPTLVPTPKEVLPTPELTPSVEPESGLVVLPLRGTSIAIGGENLNIVYFDIDGVSKSWSAGFLDELKSQGDVEAIRVFVNEEGKSPSVVIGGFGENLSPALATSVIPKRIGFCPLFFKPEHFTAAGTRKNDQGEEELVVFNPVLRLSPEIYNAFYPVAGAIAQVDFADGRKKVVPLLVDSDNNVRYDSDFQTKVAVFDSPDSPFSGYSEKEKGLAYKAALPEIREGRVVRESIPSGSLSRIDEPDGCVVLTDRAGQKWVSSINDVFKIPTGAGQEQVDGKETFVWKI